MRKFLFNINFINWSLKFTTIFISNFNKHIDILKFLCGYIFYATIIATTAIRISAWRTWCRRTNCWIYYYRTDSRGRTGRQIAGWTTAAVTTCPQTEPYWVMIAKATIKSASTFIFSVKFCCFYLKYCISTVSNKIGFFGFNDF